MTFPTPEELIPALRNVVAEYVVYNGSAEGTLEVRLQVYPDGTWRLRDGDPQYDPEHTGYWGAEEINLDESTYEDLEAPGFYAELALSLIEQAEDMYATVEEVPSGIEA